MKYITLLLLLSISTLCCAMDESYASGVFSGEVPSGEVVPGKKSRDRGPSHDGSTKSSQSEGDTGQETEEELIQSPLSPSASQLSLSHTLPSPAKGQGGSMKEIVLNEDDEGYYVGRGDEWVLVEGDDEPPALYMIAERKVPELEEIELLASPKRIALCCNDIAAVGNCQDIGFQRKYERLASKNLKEQEQLTQDT